MKRILCAVAVAFVLWLGLSTAEVMAKNLDRNPDYSTYNLWVLMMEV